MESAGETWSGLQDVLLVDDERIPRFPHLGLLDQGIEDIGVDRRAEDPAPVSLAAHDRHDEMRKLAEPHEYVADVHSPEHDLVKPFFIPVIQSLQLIGTGIGHMIPILINDAQVDKGLGAHLHQGKDLLQIPHVLQFAVSLRVGQCRQLRDTLVQEQIDRISPVFRQGPQVLKDLFRVRFTKLVVDGESQNKQRNE